MKSKRRLATLSDPLGRMRRGRRALVAVLAVVLGTLTLVGVRSASALGSGEGGGQAVVDVPDQIEAEARASGEVGVIVALTDGRGRAAGVNGTTDDPATVTQLGTELLDEVDESGPARVLDHLGAVALNASPAQLDELSRSELVRSIEPDLLLEAADAPSVNLVGAPAAWGAGFQGQNQLVAVIDSGIDSNHTALAGKVVYEACFTNGSCPNGASVQGGPGSAQPCALGLACEHGTHVAGIVAGTDSQIPGVAPAAGLVSIQVFSRSSNPADCGAGGAPCPRARTSDVLAALNHLVDARAQLPQLVAVNMSLSSDAAAPSCNNSVLAAAVTRLKAVGVATVVASGNSGATNGLGVPACIADTVSVGATYSDRDAVWPLSNVGPDLDLLAPGVAINSPAPGGGYSPTTGTSAAAPHVAGAWAIAAQRLGTNDVDTIRNFLVGSGQPVSLTLSDGSALLKPRLDLRGIAGGGTGPAASRGGFTAMTPPPAPAAGYTAVPGDFNGDGLGDLFWYGNGRTTWTWLSVGGGQFTGLAGPVAGAGFRPVPGDYDGNGLTDIFWYGNGAVSWMWLAVGGGQFSSFPDFGAGGGYRPVPGDYDGNGLTDIFWYGPGSMSSWIWLASGGRQFNSAVAWPNGGDYTLTSGDFDGDGISDLFWFNPAGFDSIWRGAGGGHFVAVAAPQIDGGYVPVSGDFNGDNRGDLLWYTPGASWKWTAAGGMQFVGEVVTAGSWPSVPVAADYDGNHQTDIYWYGRGGPDGMWLAQ